MHHGPSAAAVIRNHMHSPEYTELQKEQARSTLIGALMEVGFTDVEDQIEWVRWKSRPRMLTPDFKDGTELRTLMKTWGYAPEKHQRYRVIRAIALSHVAAGHRPVFIEHERFAARNDPATFRSSAVLCYSCWERYDMHHDFPWPDPESLFSERVG